uniref:Zinc finger and SCAN domain containing 5C n=1 Tax=Rhinopithecus bieti TaxID=61621 RepID=A0A2K6LQU5_RHIBE
MAANCTPLCGLGEPCNSPESEPPQSLPSPATQLGNHDVDPEISHVNFRMFTCPKESDPIQALRKLTELCHLWLRPDTPHQRADPWTFHDLHAPGAQVLVMMNGVPELKDLEDLLRNNRKTKKWSVVNLLGKEYLMQDSDVEMAEAPASARDDLRDVSSQWASSVKKMRPGEGQACRELQTLPRVPALFRRQEEDFLLPETIVMKGDPKALSPKPTLEKDLEEDREENPGVTSSEPQLPNGPTDLVSAKEGQEPQKRASVENVDADTPSACVVETEASTHSRNSGEAPNLRGPKGSKPDVTSISQEEPQGEATPVGNRESPGQAEINPLHSPGPAGPASHPDGQGVKELLPFACEVCSKRFKYRGKLAVHKRSHTGERRFQYNLCGNRFMQRIGLQFHQRTHTGERPYTCDVCQKQFTQKSYLKCHRRSHTGEKPFECKDCKKVFTYKANLKEHQRSHTGEKPFECKDCKKVFTYKANLKEHQRTHSGAPPP